MTSACELCAADGGELLYRDAKLRIVLVNDADYPGFCRVIWNAHVREMTDLPAVDRYYLLNTVLQSGSPAARGAAPGQDQPGQPGQCRAASALACDPALC